MKEEKFFFLYLFEKIFIAKQNKLYYCFSQNLRKKNLLMIQSIKFKPRQNIAISMHTTIIIKNK